MQSRAASLQRKVGALRSDAELNKQAADKDEVRVSSSHARARARARTKGTEPHVWRRGEPWRAHAPRQYRAAPIPAVEARPLRERAFRPAHPIGPWRARGGPAHPDRPVRPPRVAQDGEDAVQESLTTSLVRRELSGD